MTTISACKEEKYIPLESQERTGKCFQCRYPLSFVAFKRLGEWKPTKFDCPNCGTYIEAYPYQGEPIKELEDYEK